MWPNVKGLNAKQTRFVSASRAAPPSRIHNLNGLLIGRAGHLLVSLPLSLPLARPLLFVSNQFQSNLKPKLKVSERQREKNNESTWSWTRRFLQLVAHFHFQSELDSEIEQIDLVRFVWLETNSPSTPTSISFAISNPISGQSDSLKPTSFVWEHIGLCNWIRLPATTGRPAGSNLRNRRRRSATKVIDGAGRTYLRMGSSISRGNLAEESKLSSLNPRRNRTWICKRPTDRPQAQNITAIIIAYCW